MSLFKLFIRKLRSLFIRIGFYIKHTPFRKLPKFDPNKRMIGIMMIRNENDILREVLENQTTFFDRIFVLDGTEPYEEFLKGKAIMDEFDEVKLVIRDSDTDGPFPVKDGARHYLLKEVRARYGFDNWIGVLHGDEFFTRDPRSFIKMVNPYLTPVVNVRLCHFFIHSSDARNWEQIQALPVEKRITHYMWPGTPENRFFFDSGTVDYDPAVHFLVVPDNLRVKRKFDNLIIKGFNYRTPDQMDKRASQRIDSGWQIYHYKHITNEQLYFIDSLHVPGYEPTGADNWGKSPENWSKPRSLKDYPLPQAHSEISPIFIGGVGRTGSTYLKRLLGSHPELIALDWESKFLSWENGLFDLVYDFSHHKFSRFLAKMRDTTLCTFPENKCRIINNWGFRAMNGAPELLEHYDMELKHLKSVLSDTDYPEQAKLDTVEFFVRFLYDRLAISADCKGWIEQTPRNIDWACQLLRCFDNSVFIYIDRDPLDISASLIQQWWGPGTVPEIIEHLKDRYVRWNESLASIQKAGLGSRLFIIDFEEMIESKGQNLQGILQKLDLEPFEFPVSGEMANIGRWRQQFDNEQALLIQESLEAFLPKNK